jgi:hypothetical protein
MTRSAGTRTLFIRMRQAHGELGQAMIIERYLKGRQHARPGPRVCCRFQALPPVLQYWLWSSSSLSRWLACVRQNPLLLGPSLLSYASS